MHALLAIVPLYLSRIQLAREALPVALPLCLWGEAHVGQHAWPMCLHDSSIDNRVSPTIARTGCWECPTVQDMLAMLRAHRNASLLDIGANIGYYSLAAAASGAAARVNAFEASPRNVLMLQQSRASASAFAFTALALASVVSHCTRVRLRSAFRRLTRIASSKTRRGISSVFIPKSCLACTSCMLRTPV